MRLACWIVVAVAPLLLAAGPDDRAAAIGSKVGNQVERLADKLQATPPSEHDAGTGTECRWITQVMTHQGVEHTRRVRVCQQASWWSRWMQRANQGE